MVLQKCISELFGSGIPLTAGTYDTGLESHLCCCRCCSCSSSDMVEAVCSNSLLIFRRRRVQEVKRLKKQHEHRAQSRGDVKLTRLDVSDDQRPGNKVNLYLPPPINQGRTEGPSLAPWACGAKISTPRTREQIVDREIRNERS